MKCCVNDFLVRWWNGWLRKESKIQAWSKCKMIMKQNLHSNKIVRKRTNQRSNNKRRSLPLGLRFLLKKESGKGILPKMKQENRPCASTFTEHMLNMKQMKRPMNHGKNEAQEPSPCSTSPKPTLHPKSTTRFLMD